ncbi:hypothetical protein R6Q59_018843 [Mikania micrantha]
MTAFLGDPADKHEMFRSIVHELILSPINFTIMECPTIFGDKASDPSELDDQLVEATLLRMGYESLYPPTEKKLLHPYRRYLAHVVTQCLSGRKGGYDVLNQTLSSSTIAISLGVDFNYSGMAFRVMYDNIKGKRKERFLAFPRFIQIIINKRH